VLARIYLRLLSHSRRPSSHTQWPFLEHLSPSSQSVLMVHILPRLKDSLHVVPVAQGSPGDTHAPLVQDSTPLQKRSVIATLIICSARVSPVEGFIANCSGYTGITWRHAISIDAGLDTVAKTLIATIIICSARATQSLLFIAH
jgi:hypothetical protein